MLKKIALLVALVCGSVSAQNTAGTATLDPSQVYSTGNLVNNTATANDVTSTWQNIGLWNQGLPCWGPGGPVYCGPLPYFNNGSLNYSYGTADVNQTVNINNALSNIGTGLRVNGYNFGFTAKNGNGWDDGRLDYLTAYVRFTDAGDKKVVYDKSYDLNQQFNWTTFNFSETFATPFAAKDLGTVTYGIVGRDNNFWAGPYGPEVQGINFSLKYSVDPCAINPLYSPTCPGYLDALAKLIPASTATVDPVSSLSTSPTSTTTIVIDPVASTVTTTNTVTADVPRKVNESSVTTIEKKQEDNSAALNLIKKNQERDSAALGVAQTAMATANQAALASQQEAASVAAGAVANSVTVNAVNIGSQQSTGTGLRATSAVSNLVMATTGTVTGPNSVAISMLQPPVQTTQSQTGSSTVSAFEPASAPAMLVLNNNSTTQAAPQSYATLPPNFLTDRTNPLTEIVEGRQVITTNTAPVTTGPVVNANAGDNDAAGGVSISRMALAPTGYGDYLNFALRDAAFYAPKEVYRNQKTVDNARALRQLSSDARHREMVEQQYRR